MIHFQENVNVKRNKVSKKTKKWKGREAYTKGASFGALCALNTVDPHNITSCIHLHIEVLCRCSNPYFCIVKPTTTITISIKLYNLNKIYCAWILKIHHVQSKFKTKKQKNKKIEWKAKRIEEEFTQRHRDDRSRPGEDRRRREFQAGGGYRELWVAWWRALDRRTCTWRWERRCEQRRQ